jgi:FtsH-binding integral membrane protein
MDSARRYDRIFFPVLAAFMLVAVFVGFARTYYLAGVFRAPLPNLLIHIHGAVFSAWIILLIVQTLLVAARRVDLHRRLGLMGFGLACAMVALGLMSGVDEMARHSGPGTQGVRARVSFVLPITDMLVFATLVYFGYRNRFNPSAHRRYLIIATVMILDAAIVRWPIHASWWHLQAAQICSYVFLLLLVGYDLWTTGKIQRATLRASVFLVVVQQVRMPIGRTAGWQGFAVWVENVARNWR